jgi:GntR family transcriptional regulator of arabinose operon
MKRGIRSLRINIFYNSLNRNWDAVQAALDPCSAVLCYNDELAVALNYTLRERGVRLPQDLSIVGFDDLLSEYCVPPLTTISHGFREMGQEAVKTVIRMASDPQAIRRLQGQVIKVPGQLIKRESTAPLSP